MNLLLDELPESVYLADPDPPYLEREYPIATDYRVGVQFTQLLSDEALTNLEKDEQALMLYYGGIPANVEAGKTSAASSYPHVLTGNGAMKCCRHTKEPFHLQKS